MRPALESDNVHDLERRWLAQGLTGHLPHAPGVCTAPTCRVDNPGFVKFLWWSLEVRNCMPRKMRGGAFCPCHHRRRTHFHTPISSGSSRPALPDGVVSLA